MKNLNLEHLCPSGKDLASRASAKILRSQAEQVIREGRLAVIDLGDVVSISESYADELFAVLVEDHGLEWFSRNIKILHDTTKSDSVLRSIATAIRRRLEDQNKVDIKASVNDLIAAKKLASARLNGHCS